MFLARAITRATCSFFVVLSLLFVAPGHACTWAIGYFHQVTVLKGRLVGVDSHGFPRWLRQTFARKHAKLDLYRYQWPRTAWNSSLLVNSVETDGHGAFDFGSLEKNHYTLRINSGDLSDEFDVEVTNLPRNTDSVLIDISPVLPDCTGGHEFLVRPKSSKGDEHFAQSAHEHFRCCSFFHESAALYVGRLRPETMQKSPGRRTPPVD